MAQIQQLVDDAESLINYALQNKVALPSATVAILLAARAKLADLEKAGPERDGFYAAFQHIVDLLPIAAAELRASTQRSARLGPLVESAQSLLQYAAANAQKVDDDVRNPLVEVSDAVARGTPVLADEQKFFKAYEALTTKTAPVTAETLVASKTTLPDLQKLFSRDFWAATKNLTLGRFVDAVAFLIVLLATCFALGYHSLGASALIRYQNLETKLSQIQSELGKKQDVVTLRTEAVASEGKKANNTPEAVALAGKNLLEAERDVSTDKKIIRQLELERDALPNRLWKWSQQPCSHGLTSWNLCSSIDELPKGAMPSSDLAKIDAATTITTRMNDIVLPLLLGWLGAYSFVLRKMTSEISARSFAKEATLRDIVRLSLGALAGIASGWLLKTDEVGGGLLKNVPAWTLAFIAGYGIELVFSFMDRIIAAFTAKPT